MKLMMLATLGALLLTLGACQTEEMTGPRPKVASYALDNSPDNMHLNVAPGDVYLEESIDRYNLGD